MWIKDIISLAFDLHYSQDRKLGILAIYYWISIWTSNNMKKTRKQRKGLFIICWHIAISIYEVYGLLFWPYLFVGGRHYGVLT